ncbi:kinase [Xanthomonadaceae bacterium JHOS43]|nr:kinase [Xanthomonadaceae bacterium JHOS43]
MDVDALAERLLLDLASTPHPSRRSTPFLLGISGVQGSGKSTLAAALVQQARNFDAVALSLDDVYFTRGERQALARHVHPLFATRGVPGTHDLALLHATLDALATASPMAPALLPRFDKGQDDRLPSHQWPRIETPPRLIVLEGWCLGVPPQADSALPAPINALERDEDPHGQWRGHVNAQLAGSYADLWQRIDRLVLLQAPSFEVVTRWREEQETALRRRAAPQAMDAGTLQRFIAHYERLSRHALACLPALADVTIALDAERRVQHIASSA